MAVTAAQVKALREETGLPMMECKSALSETNGDAVAAKELLQKKFKGKMESRAGNVTGEGRVAIFIANGKKIGAIIDLRCETAPVAKTDQFIALAEMMAKAVANCEDENLTVESALALASPATAGRSLQDELTEVFGLLRENIRLDGIRRVCAPYLCGYVHHDGKSGVLIALDAAPNSDSVGTDLCHHVVFNNPLAITRDEISTDEISKIEQKAREAATSEGKPEQIVDKIVKGKVNAYCADNALMEQEHVKVSKTSVGDVLKQAGVTAIKEIRLYKLGG